MRGLLLRIVASGTIVIFSGCDKHRSSSLALDACALLPKEEVESVQSSPVNDIKSSQRTDDAFRVAQCFYATADSSKSVNLALVQERTDQQTRRSPKEFWKEKFGPSKNEESEQKRESDNAEREQGAAPKKIAGLGDDAYWVSNRFGGVLYILKGDAFISIGIGGTDDEATKLKKSKELAQRALQRL